MNDPAALVVTGASGRMGRTLVGLIQKSDKVQLHACLEREGHPWIGQDIGTAMGEAPVGVKVTDDPLEAFAHANAVVDFTSPSATVGFAGLAAQARIVHVIGTTGLESAHLARIESASHHAVIVRAGNMSLGVNLMAKLTEMVARALGQDWDIEIVESHHAQKVDAPSGTALMLGEAAATGRNVDFASARVAGRDGITGARVPGSIGFSSLRGGDIVGEHDVIFATAGERIILRHIATDRALFARGAIRAAIWGQTQKPGQYDMMDVLGL